MDAPARTTRVAAIAGASLLGLGVVLGVAANWSDLGRATRFALLQGLLVAASGLAVVVPRARPALALLAFLACGALFAFFGQTYQTGADAWQLFALWAALGVPLALAARHDAVWTAWVLVAMTAVALAVHAWAGWRWSTRDGSAAPFLLGWAAALALVAALHPALARGSGAGRWAHRSAAMLAVTMITLTALDALFGSSIGVAYGLGLLALAALAAVHLARRGWELLAASAAALGVDTLAVAGLARVLFEGHGRDALGSLLLLGLAAAATLALTVSLLMRRAAQVARARPRP